jgi:hypothetical protein
MDKLKAPREKRKSNRVFMYLPLEYRVRNAPYAHEGYVVDASEGGPFLIIPTEIYPSA